jgi:serine/threonine protein phosphatase PrpC
MIRQIQLFGITDVGRQRTHNEDNFAICKDVSQKQWGFRRTEILDLSDGGAVLVVADGMGGTNAGEIASDIAQQYVMDAFNTLGKVSESVRDKEKWLKDLVLGAHKAIVKHQHEHLDTAGMGTTLIVVWVVGDSLHAAWSGDSRCYIWSGEEYLRPFSDDHSMVWEMVKAGNMTPEEARTHPESNLILQSLGTDGNPPKPSVRSRKLFKGDRVLVCSDGLNGMLSDEDIYTVLKEDLDTAETCSRFVDLANEAGGHDNVTCLMLDVKDADGRPAGDTVSGGASVDSYDEVHGEEKQGFGMRAVMIVLVAFVLLVLVWFLWIRPGGNPVDPYVGSADTPADLSGSSDVDFDRGSDMVEGTNALPDRPVAPPTATERVSTRDNQENDSVPSASWTDNLPAIQPAAPDSEETADAETRDEAGNDSVNAVIPDTTGTAVSDSDTVEIPVQNVHPDSVRFPGSGTGLPNYTIPDSANRVNGRTRPGAVITLPDTTSHPPTDPSGLFHSLNLVPVGATIPPGSTSPKAVLSDTSISFSTGFAAAMHRLSVLFRERRSGSAIHIDNSEAVSANMIV